MKRFEQEQERSIPSPTSIQSSTSSAPTQLHSSSPSLSSVPSSKTPTDLQEAVRRRAYEIFEQRGMAGGSEIEDWLQAEAEILDEQNRNQNQRPQRSQKAA